MALRTWQVLQDENLPIRIGKNADTFKADLPKPTKTGLGNRKALRDLSNTDKASVPAKSKGSTFRDVSKTGKSELPIQAKGVARNKSAIRAPEMKNVPKSSFLTENEIRICDEWAKEGIELVHFTGNNLQMLKENEVEERVKKKTQSVISSLREWSNAPNDLFPMMEASEVIDVINMEMVPEDVLPPVRKASSSSGDDVDDLLDMEVDQFPFLDFALELKLKEESCL